MVILTRAFLVDHNIVAVLAELFQCFGQSGSAVPSVGPLHEPVLTARVGRHEAAAEQH